MIGLSMLFYKIFFKTLDFLPSINLKSHFVKDIINKMKLVKYEGNMKDVKQVNFQKVDKNLDMIYKVPQTYLGQE